MSADKTENRFFLRKLRVKNYKCLEDIEISFGDLTLLLGKSGAGKSAVFEVLEKLHRFIARREKTHELFPASTCTRWKPGKLQEFTLDISCANGKEDYCYHLRVSSDGGYVEEESLRIKREKNSTFRGLLLSRSNKNSQFQESCVERTSHNIPAVYKFRTCMDSIVLLSPMPFLMQNGAKSNSIADSLDANGGNYAAWHLGLMQTDPDWANAVREKIQDVLPGFSKIRKNKKFNQLSVVFTNNGKEEEYLFSELSSGQCVLIALYTLVFGDKNRLLLLDEPDNFVMLPEIQPLLGEMECEAAEKLPQIVLISHHPEAINFISPDEQVWLARNDKGASIVKPFKNDTMLHTAELYARGAAP